MRNNATIAPFMALVLAFATLHGVVFPARAGNLGYCTVGGVALEHARFDKAVEYFTLCIDEADLDEDQLIAALRARAFAYEEIGEIKKAIEDINRLIEIEPDDPMYYINRGVTLLRHGFGTLAVTDFDRAIELNPTDAEPYFLRGLAEYEIGQAVEAIADFDQAILLDPSDPDYYVHRGHAYVEIGKYDTAISDYGRALARDPLNAKIYVRRGIVYKMIGDDENSTNDLMRALELDPNSLLQP